MGDQGTSYDCITFHTSACDDHYDRMIFEEFFVHSPDSLDDVCPLCRIEELERKYDLLENAKWDQDNAVIKLEAEVKRRREALERKEKLEYLAAQDVVFWSTYNDATDQHDDKGHPAIICNDLFCPGADAEGIEESEIDKVFDAYKTGGDSGIEEWIKRKRKALEKTKAEN